MDTVVLYFFTLFSLIGTFIPSTESKKWWIVGQTYFRQWYFVLNLALLLIWLSHSPYSSIELTAIIFLIVATWQCFRDIIPYTKFYPTEIKTNKSLSNKSVLSVLIYNVKEDNERYDEIIELQKKIKPTILLLLETNERWAAAMETIKNSYSDLITEIREDTYGIMMFSQLEYKRGNIKYLSDEDIPSADVKVELNGQNIQLLALHPKPPIPGEALTSKQKDREYKIAAKTLKRSREKNLQIVFGDLNDVVWSKTSRKFKKQTGLKDPRVGRGTYSTFPTYSPVRFPLDQIFCSPSIELIELKRLPDIGSDHYPIFFKLAIPKLDNRL